MKLKITGKELSYAGILAFIALYVLTGNAIFAFGTFACLIYVIYQEFFNQKNAVGEALTSLGFALVAWIVISLVLNTTSPINIITSCSMLPNLERGDVIILQGVGSFQTQETATIKTLGDAEYRQFFVRGENASAKLVVPLLRQASKACERMAANLKKGFPGLKVIDLDRWLYLESKKTSPNDKPRHRALTTAH